MTYCIGWKSEKCVFLVADSALTGGAAPSFNVSSFGELHECHRGDMVEEIGFKLMRTRDVVFAFSGDLQTALRFVKEFNDYHEYFDDVFECFEHTSSAITQSDSYRIVNIMAAFYQDSKAHLVTIRPDAVERITEHDQSVHIGSMPGYFKDISRSIVGALKHFKISDEHFLVTVTSIVQSFGIFTQLMQYNVGGFYFGVSISADGSKWMDDTSYLLYPPTLDKFDFISGYIRDNAGIVCSPHTNGIRVFGNSANYKDTQVITTQSISEIFQLTKCGKSLYYVFLCTHERKITIVKTSSPNENKYFKLTTVPDAELNFDIGLSQDFYKILSRPMAIPPDSELPFSICFLNA